MASVAHGSRQAIDPNRLLGAPASTDATLLAQCRKGDAAAWEALVERYERLVFSVALRNGVSRADAADVTQTTFVALLDAIDQVRDTERLASWLMTVARRHAWRVRRRAERDSTAEAVGIDTANPIDDWERVAWVYEGLQQLAEPCRNLLTALYFDPSSPSYAEIAERLGRSVGGIGPMRARCLAHLRTIMDDQG